MEATMQTMSVKKLIARLKLIEKQCGDLPVVLSSDSEGNNFGTIHNTSVGVCCGLVLIMPFVECVDITTIDGYKKE